MIVLLLSVRLDVFSRNVPSWTYGGVIVLDTLMPKPEPLHIHNLPLYGTVVDVVTPV